MTDLIFAERSSVLVPGALHRARGTGQRLRRALEDGGHKFGAHHVQPGGHRADPLGGKQRQRRFQRRRRGIERTRTKPDDGQVNACERLAREPVLLAGTGTGVVSFHGAFELLGRFAFGTLKLGQR